MNEIQMPEPMSSMMDEHQRIVSSLRLLVTAIGDDTTPAKTLGKLVNDFTNKLDAHVNKEEMLLFPLIRHALGDRADALAIMETEHTLIANLRNDFLSLATGLSTENLPLSDNKMRLVDLLNSAEEVLPAHIFKEDHVLYPLASQIIPTGKLVELAGRAKQLP